MYLSLYMYMYMYIYIYRYRVIHKHIYIYIYIYTYITILIINKQVILIIKPSSRGSPASCGCRCLILLHVDWPLVPLCVLGCFAPDAAFNAWGFVCDAQLEEVRRPHALPEQDGQHRLGEGQDEVPGAAGAPQGAAAKHFKFILCITLPILTTYVRGVCIYHLLYDLTHGFLPSGYFLFSSFFCQPARSWPRGATRTRTGRSTTTSLLCRGFSSILDFPQIFSIFFDFHALFPYSLTFGEKSPAKNKAMGKVDWAKKEL